MSTPGETNISTRFRKKPVVIDAIQWTGNNIDEVMPFFGDLSKLPSDGIHVQPGIGHVPALGHLIIPTLEGDHTALPGDWIIKGVKGEFYPCKPDIFGITYEPETTSPASAAPAAEQVTESDSHITAITSSIAVNLGSMPAESRETTRAAEGPLLEWAHTAAKRLLFPDVPLSSDVELAQDVKELAEFVLSLKQPASPAQAAPLTRTLFGIRSKCDGTHRGPMEEVEAREWVRRFPDAYILVSKEETRWAKVEK